MTEKERLHQLLERWINNHPMFTNAEDMDERLDIFKIHLQGIYPPHKMQDAGFRNQAANEVCELADHVFDQGFLQLAGALTVSFNEYVIVPQKDDRLSLNLNLRILDYARKGQNDVVSAKMLIVLTGYAAKLNDRPLARRFIADYKDMVRTGAIAKENAFKFPDI